MLAPNFWSCTAPTNAMIMPTRKLISVTIGSAWTPHSWTISARSRHRKRARPVTSRPRASVASPMNARALALCAAARCAPTPTRASHDAAEIGRARARLLGDRLRDRQQALHGGRKAVPLHRHLVRRARRPPPSRRRRAPRCPSARSADMSNVTPAGGGVPPSACSTRAVSGSPSSSAHAPASRTTSLPVAAALDPQARCRSAASARRSPELLTAIFRALGLLLARRRDHKARQQRPRRATTSCTRSPHASRSRSTSRPSAASSRAAG